METRDLARFQSMSTHKSLSSSRCGAGQTSQRVLPTLKSREITYHVQREIENALKRRKYAFKSAITRKKKSVFRLMT